LDECSLAVVLPSHDLVAECLSRLQLFASCRAGHRVPTLTLTIEAVRRPTCELLPALDGELDEARGRSPARTSGRWWLWQSPTAFLALLALIALRARIQGAIALVWVCVGVGMLDTLNAIIQSIRYCVFTYALGINWVIVTLYVPALLVSSLLIFWLLLGLNQSPNSG
jgi:hypothetical protein